MSYVMDQMGHGDSKMTMDVYSKALKSKRRWAHARPDRGGVGPRARRGREWAGNGH